LADAAALSDSVFGRRVQIYLLTHSFTSKRVARVCQYQLSFLLYTVYPRIWIFFPIWYLIYT